MIEFGVFIIVTMLIRKISIVISEDGDVELVETQAKGSMVMRMVSWMKMRGASGENRFGM